ncbi:MAG: hypothetical protein LR006_00060, partial [Dehalococcoidia bacterium]|nr:hypothetical protein [Dehalococcoidia bacterium]
HLVKQILAVLASILPGDNLSFEGLFPEIIARPLEAVFATISQQMPSIPVFPGLFARRLPLRLLTQDILELSKTLKVSSFLPHLAAS